MFRSAITSGSSHTCASSSAFGTTWPARRSKYSSSANSRAVSSTAAGPRRTIRAEVEPVGLVILAVLGGQDEHRHPVLLGPQLRADLVAGQARQHDVEHHAVVAALAGHVQAGDAVAGDIDGEPRSLEAALDRGGQPPLVLNDKHSHGYSVPQSRSCPYHALSPLTAGVRHSDRTGPLDHWRR